MKELKWKVANSSNVPATLGPWLLDSHSFMERLKQFGVQDARIEVLNQCWQLPTREDCQRLQLNPKRYVLVREVLIRSEKINWMVARAVFPQQTVTGSLRQLIYLKNRALGSVLFKDPSLVRSDFEIAYFSKENMLHHSIMKRGLLPTESWARRSIFNLRNKKILLTEYFFPAGFLSL